MDVRKRGDSMRLADDGVGKNSAKMKKIGFFLDWQLRCG